MSIKPSTQLDVGYDIVIECLRYDKLLQEGYQGWLQERGIKDKAAYAEITPANGVLGVKGPERAKETGCAYEPIPTEVTIEINRKFSGRPPANRDLAQRLLGQ